MVKFKEAQARKFTNMFVCKKCSTKIRTQNVKIIQGKVKCRRCQSKKFRAVRKK
jgi:formylmethanofuran dehydrogenase subunit E